MPLYGSPQSGYNPILPAPNCKNIGALEVGQQVAMFDGTETVSTGSKSVAFARGFHEGFNSPVTYSMSGCAAGTVIEIQYAAADVDIQYTVVGTLTPDTNGDQTLTLTDSAPFIRALISSFVGGDVPVLKATRL